MPLENSTSKKAFQDNVRELAHNGTRKRSMEVKRRSKEFPKFPDSYWFPIWGIDSVSIAHRKTKKWRDWTRKFKEWSRAAEKKK